MGMLPHHEWSEEDGKVIEVNKDKKGKTYDCKQHGQANYELIQIKQNDFWTATKSDRLVLYKGRLQIERGGSRWKLSETIKGGMRTQRYGRSFNVVVAVDTGSLIIGVNDKRDGFREFPKAMPIDQQRQLIDDCIKNGVFQGFLMFSGKMSYNQKCPECKVLTYKFAACNHMTCIKCKHEWCWLCRGKYKGHWKVNRNPFTKCSFELSTMCGFPDNILFPKGSCTVPPWWRPGLGSCSKSKGKHRSKDDCDTAKCSGWRAGAKDNKEFWEKATPKFKAHYERVVKWLKDHPNCSPDEHPIGRIAPQRCMRRLPMRRPL